MFRLTGFIFVALGLAMTSAAAPPNVVFLLTDDQRPDTIAALGNEVIHTPNLDRLAREGVAFTRAVSPYPLCVPSRAEMLTGCSSFASGVYPGRTNRLDPGLALWPEVLHQAGYHTWHVGKWHVSGRPSMRGYSDSLGLFSGGGRTQRAPGQQLDARGRVVTGYRGWVFQTDDRRLFPAPRGYPGVGLTPNIDARFADAAIELIRRKPDKPFFLHVNFTGPHDPLYWPAGYEDLYDPAEMPLPKNYQPRHPFNHGNFWGRDELLLPWPRTKEDVRHELALYYAVISHIDEQVGRIMTALEETGQLDNTLVIFASDHGLAVGSHGLRGKQNMYEHTIGVPMIFRGPGVPEGQAREAQVYLRDLFPTVCDAANIAIPKSVRAKSHWSVVQGERKSMRDAAFCYFADTQRMVRTERWKLIQYPQVERWQLFDLQSDPFELNNLSDNPRYQDTMRTMRRLLREQQRAAGDFL